MKTLFGEYYKIIMYTIFGLMFVMAGYIIIINIHHYNSLNNFVVVSDIDNNYKSFMNNVNEIESNLTKYNGGEKNKLIFNKVLTSLKKDGVFRLIPKTKLKYRDLYNLNDYFINELINNNWVINFQKLDISKKYSYDITFIINNSNYLNNMFLKNGLTLYDSFDNNKIVNDYQMILNNYLMYSNIILDIIGDNNE